MLSTCFPSLRPDKCFLSFVDVRSRTRSRLGKRRHALLHLLRALAAVGFATQPAHSGHDLGTMGLDCMSVTRTQSDKEAQRKGQDEKLVHSCAVTMRMGPFSYIWMSSVCHLLVRTRVCAV